MTRLTVPRTDLPGLGPAGYGASAGADRLAQRFGPLSQTVLDQTVAAAGKAAMVALGWPGPAQEHFVEDGTTRNASDPVLGMDRAGIALSPNSGASLPCGVGITTTGPTLTEDGRIG